MLLQLAVLACSGIAGLSSLAEPTNRFEVKDMFRIETLAGGTFSPDGRSFIFERTRPFDLNHDAGSNQDPYHRTDFWLVGAGDAQAQKLTDGQAKKAGDLATSFWSPDGQRLAFFSTKGEKQPHLWLWEKNSGKFSQLSKNPVNMRSQVKWIDSTHLLCDVVCDSEVGWLDSVGEGDLIRRMTAGWSNIWAGQVTTASLMESGATNLARTGAYAGVLLVRIDVATGKETVLDRGFGLRTEISPDNQRMLVYQGWLGEMNTAVRIPGKFDHENCIDLIDLRTGLVVTSRLSSIILSRMKGWQGTSSLAWSPDSKQIALIGIDSIKGSRRSDLMIYDVATDNLTPMPLDGIKVETNKMLYWQPDGKIIVAARSVGWGKANSDNSNRVDWWAVSSGAKPKNLTAAIKKPVSELLRETGKSSFVCRADDALWRISDNGTTSQNLTASLGKPISGVILPSDKKIGTAIVLKSGEGKTNELVWLDLDKGKFQFITRPSPEAELADYAPKAGALSFEKSDRTGCRLWRAAIGENGMAQTPTLLAETSMFLADIAVGELRSIKYTSLDGQPLDGWILLPANYQPGKQYPMVAWVYAGSVHNAKDKSSVSSYTEINGCTEFNFQLLASHGYAVLFPSMPLKPPGQADDPLLELTKGVIPAVDKAIEIGIADPERLGVFGQSYGGYSTYGLITQTTRFKAAVAMAGLSDLVSVYGTLGADSRYMPDPNMASGDFTQSWSESSQGRMGSPPWKDLGRYIRNSPITYVDRVETPLLITQGDLDYVPIQQGEEFFQSLYRQGKRAEFARYWGEGHVFESPANIEDKWNRVFRWFDTYLKAPDNGNSTKADEVAKGAANK